MKRLLSHLMTIFVFPLLLLLLVGCTMPMAPAPRGEMLNGNPAHERPMGESAASDDAMAALPTLTAGELTVANVRANLALPSPTGSVPATSS